MAQRERASAYPTPVPLPKEKTTKEASGFPSIVATYSRDAEAYANNVLWGNTNHVDEADDEEAPRYLAQDDDASELSFDLRSFASNASGSQRSQSAPPSSPSAVQMRMPPSPYELSLTAIAVRSRFFEGDTDAEPATNPRPRRRKTRPLKRRLRPINYIGAGR